MRVHCGHAVRSFKVQGVPVTPRRHLDASHTSRGCCKHGQSFPSLRFQINARVKMIASQFSKIPTQEQGNVEWVHPFMLRFERDRVEGLSFQHSRSQGHSKTKQHAGPIAKRTPWRLDQTPSQPLHSTHPTTPAPRAQRLAIEGRVRAFMEHGVKLRVGVPPTLLGNALLLSTALRSCLSINPN
jgi:hypothetical protein